MAQANEDVCSSVERYLGPNNKLQMDKWDEKTALNRDPMTFLYSLNITPVLSFKQNGLLQIHQCLVNKIVLLTNVALLKTTRET